MLKRANELMGFRIHASDADLGHVRDLFVDEQTWVVRHIVVDTGHWLPGRQVLVSPHSVVGVDWTRHRLATALTSEQVRTSPATETDRPASNQHDTDGQEYVNLFFFWTDELVSPIPAAAGAPVAAPRGDPHLHSVRALTTYSVRAVDGELGQVADVAFDDESWTVDDLVVDLRRRLPGERVLVPSASVASIHAPELTVRLRVSADAVPLEGTGSTERTDPARPPGR